MRASFRVSFTDFIVDPDDDDCRRRATTIRADRITFEDRHLILWVGDIERVRFPMETIKAIEVARDTGSNQGVDPDQLRERYPNFGKPWSTADEEKLLTLYRSGQRNYEELAAEFGRQPSAIQSRLSKLGLEQL
ncbi:hypothetical protein AB0O32_00940 [Streptomyces rubiginosohelvolus]|uniref:hypothetical protein n=1 Tax=Streptomyces rubiginosohelvolus TaxID=67362 RepID=UPI00342550CA